jgi:transcriptional regulator with XRE-family HTH domain
VNLPERVKHARTKRRLSQRALSEAAGKRPTYIAQLENDGIKRPSYEAMVNMARVLRVPIPWLAEGKGREPAWGKPKRAA